MNKYNNQSSEQIIDYQAAYVEEKRRRELAEQQLLVAEKLASVGQLAAGINHEVSNPLAYAKSNMELLAHHITPLLALDQMAVEVLNGKQSKEHYWAQRDASDIDDLKQEIVEIIQEAQYGLERINEITRSFKAAAYQGDSVKLPCDINQCIASALNMVTNELKYSMTIHTELCNNLPSAIIDFGQIQQVLINLFINAKHACGENGNLWVKSSLITSKDVEFIQLEVKDDGHGIPKAIQSKIFEPFFTTKPVGQGSGLGLSVSLNYIKAHNGRFRVLSEKEVGTTFTLLLPVSMVQEQ